MKREGQGEGGVHSVQEEEEFVNRDVGVKVWDSMSHTP